MKKIKALFLMAVLLAACAAFAQNVSAFGSQPNYEEFTSTIIEANRGSRLANISTGVVTFGYYQVLSTGIPTDTLNFYDAYLATDQANRVSVSTGFPVNVIGTYPLDLTCTTGAFVTVDSLIPTKARVRLNYKIIQKGNQ